MIGCLGAGANSLGMMVPVDAGLFGERSWAVLIEYEEDGHVKDDDAHDIDYDELLESMKTSRNRAQRRRQLKVRAS